MIKIIDFLEEVQAKMDRTPGYRLVGDILVVTVILIIAIAPPYLILN